jgi:hypothetical protein
MNPIANVLLSLILIEIAALVLFIRADVRRHREDREAPRPRVTTIVSGPFGAER